MYIQAPYFQNGCIALYHCICDTPFESLLNSLIGISLFREEAQEVPGERVWFDRGVSTISYIITDTR